MSILAIDTSETYCSAAIVTPDGSALSRMENIGRGHAECLLPMIEDLLSEANLSYSNLSRIAVITGPGTFTGLRIGLSVARGLALAQNIPCIGLMSMPVMAAELLENSARGANIIVKGRGGQVFHQCFTSNENGALPISLSEALNIDLDIAVELIDENTYPVGGSGTALISYSENHEISHIITPNPVRLAKLAAQLAPSKYPPEPTYLRAADAAKAKKVFEVRDS